MTISATGSTVPLAAGSQWLLTLLATATTSPRDLSIHSPSPVKVNVLIVNFSNFFTLGGKWTIVPGVAVSDFSREKLTATANELEEERKLAFEFLNIA